MVRIVCLCLAVVLLLCNSPVLSESTSAMKVQCPDEFMVQSVDVAKDGTILLAGMDAFYSSEPVPLMRGVNLQGEVLWTIEGKGGRSTWGDFFRTAKYLEDGSIVALLTWGGDVTSWMMQFYRNGQLNHEILIDGDIFGIYPVQGGFLSFNSPKLYDSRVSMMNMDGTHIWDAAFERGLHFAGILSSGKTHVGFGDKPVRKGKKLNGSRSVILALDEHGENTLWRHESTSDSEEFLAGAITDDDRVVLVGDVSGDGQDRGAFIAKYDEGGELWRTRYRYEIDGEAAVVWKSAVLPVQRGILCALSEAGQSNAVRMLMLDHTGQIIAEWDEPTGDLGGRTLLHLHEALGDILLIASGYRKRGTETDVAALEEDNIPITPPARSTIICKISIPD